MTVIAYLLAGGALGAMFFGGLWWTVRSALTSANPALWLLISSASRMAALLAAFYLICRIQWVGLIAALAGFLLVRVVATRAAAGI
jgi:F1F0 ATPase subunit 2